MLPLIDVLANDIDPAGVELEAALPVAWLGAKLGDAEARAVAPGRIAGRLSRSGRADIVVRARIECDVEMPCARCLEPASVAVRTELSLLLKPAPSKFIDGSRPPGARATRGPRKKKAVAAKPEADPVSAASGVGLATPSKAPVAAKAKKPPRDKPSRGEYEFAAPEADLDEYDGERVVLDEFVREAILLELPSFPLCREDCGEEQRAQAAKSGQDDDQADQGQADHRQAEASADERSFLDASEAASQPAARAQEGDGSKSVRANPFAALRHLFSGGSPLPSAETAGNARPPSPAEQKRATRGKKRKKPRIHSSAVGRSKK